MVAQLMAQSTATGSATPETGRDEFAPERWTLDAAQQEPEAGGQGEGERIDRADRRRHAQRKSAPSAERRWGASSLTALKSAAVASSSHISEVTWFMCEPLMNTTNGARAKARGRGDARSGAARPGGGVVRRPRRSRRPRPAPRATRHRTSDPRASIAGPPAGNWPYTLPVSMRCMLLVNSGCAGAGSQSRPLAKIRAWITWMISSISSGRPLNTMRATTRYSTRPPRRCRPRRRRRRPPQARREPRRPPLARRRRRIATTAPTPRQMAVPESQPSSSSWNPGTAWPPGIQLAMGRKPSAAMMMAAADERRMPSARGPAGHVVRLGGKRLKRTIWKKAATPSFQPIFLPSA